MCRRLSRPAPWGQWSELLVGKGGLENQREPVIRYRGQPELHSSVTQILCWERLVWSCAVMDEINSRTGHIRRA